MKLFSQLIPPDHIEIMPQKINCGEKIENNNSLMTINTPSTIAPAMKHPPQKLDLSSEHRASFGLFNISDAP
eukprot:UN03111